MELTQYHKLKINTISFLYCRCSIKGINVLQEVIPRNKFTFTYSAYLIMCLFILRLILVFYGFYKNYRVHKMYIYRKLFTLNINFNLK